MIIAYNSSGVFVSFCLSKQILEVLSFIRNCMSERMIIPDLKKQSQSHTQGFLSLSAVNYLHFRDIYIQGTQSSK